MKLEIRTLEGTAIPVRGNDIDTDRIIPARFMKCVTFEGLGAYAFHDVRFEEDGRPKQHPFNDARYRGGSILLVNKNFGCGSSREHAPQALQKFGIRAVIGESFAEIFAGNCVVMGIPALTIAQVDMEWLMRQVEHEPKEALTIDLVGGHVRAGAKSIAMHLPDSARHALVNGTWDSTGLLLENRDRIEATAARLPYLHGFKRSA